ncbi:spore germination lipoprotein GerD [Paenibacillus senegalensis]|uniref:spore germination lipoprotein GerD n=1 Tax=Paenibacillus senegalensis TaxID=1465766 RepID=UPI00028A3880|nr:spore germination lipoprotein GerD [Paenibacillus senegalensis]
MKWSSIRLIALLLLACVLATSCGAQQQSEQSSLGYKDVKSMLLDILNSDEGQQAVQQAVNRNQNETMRLLSTGEGQQIQLAVKEVLTDPNYTQLIEQTMLEPKFAGDFAKSLQKYSKQLNKDLMKDPEYQQQMLELMNNEQFKALVMETMKSPEYRQQTIKMMDESLKSPLFKVQLMELFRAVVREESRPQPPPKSDQQKSGEGQGEQGSQQEEDSQEGEGEGEGEGGEEKQEQNKDEEEQS